MMQLDSTLFCVHANLGYISALHRCCEIKRGVECFVAVSMVFQISPAKESNNVKKQMQDTRQFMNNELNNLSIKRNEQQISTKKKSTKEKTKKKKKKNIPQCRTFQSTQ